MKPRKLCATYYLILAFKTTRMYKRWCLACKNYLNATTTFQVKTIVDQVVGPKNPPINHLYLYFVFILCSTPYALCEPITYGLKKLYILYHLYLRSVSLWNQYTGCCTALVPTRVIEVLEQHFNNLKSLSPSNNLLNTESTHQGTLLFIFWTIVCGTCII